MTKIQHFTQLRLDNSELTDSIFSSDFSIPENVLAQKLDDTIVLLNIENESYYSLNLTGSFIWQILIEQRQAEKAIQKLLQFYVVDETENQTEKRKDIAYFIQGLLEAGLLQANEIITDEIGQETIENFSYRCIPYETPKLIKHGTINDQTLTTTSTAGAFDSSFGSGYDNS